LQMARIVGVRDFELAPAESDLAGIQNRSRRFDVALKHPVVAVTRPPTQRILKHSEDVEPVRKWVDAASGMRRVIDERRVHSRLKVSIGPSPMAGKLMQVIELYRLFGSPKSVNAMVDSGESSFVGGVVYA
jgi:hypothetical protein